MSLATFRDLNELTSRLIIREQWVQSMMARLIREEMGKCYYREGVNHLEKCGHLRGELALLSTIGEDYRKRRLYSLEKHHGHFSLQEYWGGGIWRAFWVFFVRVRSQID